MSQISLALVCLHVNGCFHGDIKPANILVNTNSKGFRLYYLTDYGEGQFVGDNIETNYN